jgi:hypothetical protein
MINYLIGLEKLPQCFKAIGISDELEEKYPLG